MSHEKQSTVFHLIPDSVFANTYHGSYKDTISRVRYLENHETDYHKVCLRSDDPSQAELECSGATAPKFLIEYSSFPKTVAFLRQRFPSSFMAVRSHNIEPLQHLDNHGWWSDRGPIWNGYAMSRLLRNDIACKRHASEIWSINDWEKKTYWNRLPGAAVCQWLPYHCPQHLLPSESESVVGRTRIACLPTSRKNRKSWDLVTRFIAMADQLSTVPDQPYEFVITGDLSDWELPQSPNVRMTGMVDDLGGFLETVRGVAMLSNLGFGYKTTIGDAIARGACVLVHPKLAERCPDEVRPALISVDSERIGDLNRLLDQINQFQSCASIDEQLRHQNELLLTQLLNANEQ